MTTHGEHFKERKKERDVGAFFDTANKQYQVQGQCIHCLIHNQSADIAHSQNTALMINATMRRALRMLHEQIVRQRKFMRSK
jgi:predicted 3-demethylubiquinone-9 3-methyltransferase (glyoxalase superfamily)